MVDLDLGHSHSNLRVLGGSVLDWNEHRLWSYN